MYIPSEAAQSLKFSGYAVMMAAIVPGGAYPNLAFHSKWDLTIAPALSGVASERPEPVTHAKDCNGGDLSRAVRNKLPVKWHSEGERRRCTIVTEPSEEPRTGGWRRQFQID